MKYRETDKVSNAYILYAIHKSVENLDLWIFFLALIEQMFKWQIAEPEF